MDKSFDDILIETFEKIDLPRERVNLASLRLFVCGGTVDVKHNPPPSFRSRFSDFTAARYPDIHDAIIQAEYFKDYFKENAYPDLLVFEEEIANISSLVIIFLESPGSLVELGMFCSKPQFYRKLLIVAPLDKVQAEDSFIYLGPLEYIRKIEKSSVAIYPWPDATIEKYDEAHLVDLCETIREKRRSAYDSVKFDKANSGHIALLIADLISICYPIILDELELIIHALKLDIPSSHVSRHLYLLEKLKIVTPFQYSGYKYYYPLKQNISYLSFSGARQFDLSRVKMSLRQSYSHSENAPDRKRRNAYKEISKFFPGDRK